MNWCKKEPILKAYCILRKMRKLRIGSVNAQYMCKICPRFSPNTQDLCKIVLLSPMCNICAKDLHKIVLISPMCNIFTRFAQDCTYFPNAQYMCKSCARLYFFPQCDIYAQDCTYFPNAQYMRKIVLISLMRNICARLYLTSNLKC